MSSDLQTSKKIPPGNANPYSIHLNLETINFLSDNLQIVPLLVAYLSPSSACRPHAETTAWTLATQHSKQPFPSREVLPIQMLDLPALCQYFGRARGMMEAAVSNCGLKMEETTQVIQLIIYVPIFFFNVLFNALALLVFHCKQSKRAMYVCDQLNHCTLFGSHSAL